LFLLLALVVGWARGCVLSPGASYSGGQFNRGQNAAWLSVSWVNEPHDAQEIRALAEDLARRQVRYAYVYASYRKPAGYFNPSYDHAATFVSTLKAACQELSVQAWIGLPVRDFGLTTDWNVELGDPTIRQYVAAFCAHIIAVGGFDGVHLDPEPVRDGNQGLLALLEDVRASIGSEKTLSIATRRIAPLLAETRLPMNRWLMWSADYYRQVARRVDQVALMTYDSALPLPSLYRLWGRWQTIALTRALDGEPVEVFIGIPTSEEKTLTHWPTAENMTSGLRGLVEGLNDARARPAALTGVAIYPHWETDETEWAVYEVLWLGER